MNTWSREHKTSMGVVPAMVIKRENDYMVTIIEPSGLNKHARDNDAADTLEEAQHIGDDIVQREYPHDCAQRECGEWKKRGRIVNSSVQQ